MERIDLNGQPLNLDLTLACGQAFRWRKRDDGIWRGVVSDKLVELLVDGDALFWRTYPSHDKALVEDYLRLSDDVNAILAELISPGSSPGRTGGAVSRPQVCQTKPGRNSAVVHLFRSQQHSPNNSRHRCAFRWLWRFGLRAFGVVLLCISQGRGIGRRRSDCSCKHAVSGIPRAEPEKRRAPDAGPG